MNPFGIKQYMALWSQAEMRLQVQTCACPASPPSAHCDSGTIELLSSFCWSSLPRVTQPPTSPETSLSTRCVSKPASGAGDSEVNVHSLRQRARALTPPCSWCPGWDGPCSTRVSSSGRHSISCRLNMHQSEKTQLYCGLN